MTIPSAPLPTGIFTVGKVLNTTFGVLLRNLGGFVILAVLVQIGIYLIDEALGVNAADTGAPEAISPGVGFISAVINLLGFSFLSAMVSYGTFRDLRGERVGVGAVVVQGFQVLLPVLAVGLVTVVIYIVGFILAIIPGIVAMVFLWVAVPAAVIERPGVFGALGRSIALTKGERWRILGIFALFVGIFLVFLGLTGAYGFVVGADGTLSEAGIEAAINGPAEIAGLLFGMVLSLVMSIAAAVSYFLLRSQKEGIAVADLGAVFD